MIRYTLRCDTGHTFESWFPSSDSYEKQKAHGFVACPECGSAKVEKAIMAPAVARTDRAPAPPPAPVPEAPGAAPTSAPVTLVNDRERELVRVLRELREHVTRNADYVGDDFADLARKMHEGEVEHRSIYGEATVEEVRALREDEVDVIPLPVLPDERN